MKKIILKIYYLFFTLQCKFLKFFFSDYAFFSITAKKFIISPTIAQLKAADRDLFPRNIRKYKLLFKRLGVSKNKNSIILDIGGNIGYSAIAFRKSIQEKSIDIYSFEPYPPNLFYIKKNITKHNIKLFTFGLGNSNKTMDIGFPFYTEEISNKDNKRNTGRVSFVGLDTDRGDKDSCLKAMIRNGDEFIQGMEKLRKISFIKIDVEGFELQVLKGLTNTINISKPIIQMEANPVTMKIANITVFDVISFAKEVDYLCYLFKKTKLELIDINTSLPSGVNELILCPKRKKLKVILLV